MNVWLFEDNLMWSARLERALRGLGHQPSVRTTSTIVDAPDVAIVNLGRSTFDLESLVPALLERGVYVVGHAGHKEKDLLDRGQRLRCSKVATNSEVANKMASILAEAGGRLPGTG